MRTPIHFTPIFLMAVVLIAIGTTKRAVAAAPALNGQLVLRSITPQDIKDYSLGSLQGASGLSTVGLGQPAHLEAWVNIAIPAANVLSVTWALTNKPMGSVAVLANSPLGVNVPIDRPSERLVSQVAGRKFLRPDVAGQYTVTATITTSTSGTTNLTQTITAGTHMGINTCSLCHSGGLIAPNKVVPWLGTLHATKFTRGINGQEGTNYGVNDIPFHTVGYDTNTNAVNGGFDDVARQLGWTFPATLNTNNWDAVPAALQNVSNIQCENCHGPGSEHAFSLGNTNRIATSFNTGLCGQCHDNKDDINGVNAKVTSKVAEWKHSGHAVAPRQTAANCVRCHNAQGFADFIKGKPGMALPYEPIACAACHEPHDATNPHQLRAAPLYTLPEGTTVTNAGLGALCMQCHHSRNGSAEVNIANYQTGQPTWLGGSSFGVHHSPQGDMVEGVNAITYGKAIPSGSHRAALANVCVDCHMQPVASTDPAFTLAGGHTFSMTYQVLNGGVTNTIDKVDVCIKCHGQITSFDFARKDYNGDGVIEGVQTEIQRLVDKLSTMLPNSTYRSDGNYVGDGLVKTSLSVKTNWQLRFLRAAYNWQFVTEDRSKGVHNAPYAVGLLKASMGDLTGDANNDSLPDAWQLQYFGADWASNPNAAPNASPAGDGVPNWLKYSLGLNPLVAGLLVPDGVVWADASSIGGSANSIHIYTAAEIAFNTEVGKSYQIQSVSALSSGWQNIGGPIAGTGQATSYVTPTRSSAQRFYRVVHTP